MPDHTDARGLCPADLDDFHGLMEFKRALAEQYPPDEAFAWYRELVGLSPSARLVPKRIVGLREAARMPGNVYQELAPSGVPFEIAPPAIVGPGSMAAGAYTSRALFVAGIANARVRSHSDLIEIDDSILLDAEPHELADVEDRLETAPPVFSVAGDTAMVVEDASDVLTMPEAFVSLLGAGSGAFGDWMWMYLPKYLSAIASGALPHVPVLIDAGMPRQHRQALAFLLDDLAPVIEVRPHQVVALERAWCAPTLCYFPLYETIGPAYPHYTLCPPERYAAAFAIMRRAAARTPDGTPARIYLARRKTGRHDLLNMEAVEAVLHARGFATIYPEDYDFAEQARIVGHAEYIIGPEGSGMYTSFFARPGTNYCSIYRIAGLDEEIALTSLLRSIGVDVTLLVGDVVSIPDPSRPNWIHYSIELPFLESFLDGWLDERAATP